MKFVNKLLWYYILFFLLLLVFLVFFYYIVDLVFGGRIFLVLFYYGFSWDGNSDYLDGGRIFFFVLYMDRIGYNNENFELSEFYILIYFLFV